MRVQANEAQESKRRRTTNSAAKKIQKLHDALTATFSSLRGLSLQKEPVTILVLFGPSSSRPREALEIVFSPLPYQDQGTDQNNPSDGQKAVISAEATRKSCCKATRKLLPVLNSLPLPKSAGSTKMFVAVAGHPCNEDLKVAYNHHFSLKQCKAWTILRIRTTAKVSDVKHIQSYLQRQVQQQLRPMDQAPELDLNNHSCLAFCNSTVPTLSFTTDVFA